MVSIQFEAPPNATEPISESHFSDFFNVCKYAKGVKPHTWSYVENKTFAKWGQYVHECLWPLVSMFPADYYSCSSLLSILHSCFSSKFPSLCFCYSQFFTLHLPPIPAPPFIKLLLSCGCDGLICLWLSFPSQHTDQSPYFDLVVPFSSISRSSPYFDFYLQLRAVHLWISSRIGRPEDTTDIPVNHNWSSPIGSGQEIGSEGLKATKLENLNTSADTVLRSL